MTPLVLADGTKIDTSTGEVLRDRVNHFDAIPAERADYTFTPRGLDEIGIQPDMLRAVVAVCGLSILGLSDFDIAHTLGTTREKVQAVRELGAYGKVSDYIVQGVAEAFTNDARMIFAKQSRGAAKRMIELADSEDEKVAQKATADVLDRAGMRPADVHMHKISLDGTLRIEHIKNDPGAVIDVTVEK